MDGNDGYACGGNLKVGGQSQTFGRTNEGNMHTDARTPTTAVLCYVCVELRGTFLFENTASVHGDGVLLQATASSTCRRYAAPKICRFVWLVLCCLHMALGALTPVRFWIHGCFFFESRGGSHLTE